MKRHCAAALICIASLANAWASDTQTRIAAAMKVAPDTEFVIDVSSANNFISNKMMLAALKSGTDSSDALKIAAMLQRPVPAILAITGNNDSIAAATLERAFDIVKGKTLTAQKVVYVGSQESGTALSAKASELGLQLVVVPFE